MSNYFRKYFSRMLIISGFLIIIDFFSKSFIVDLFLKDLKSNYKIFSFLDLIYVSNVGVSFGILNGKEYSNILFLLINSIAVCYILLLSYKEKEKKVQNCLICIFSGGVGNLIDRIRFGYVVDFIDLHFFNLHWPVFNLADTFISLSSVYLLFYYFNQRFASRKKYFFILLVILFFILLLISNCSKKSNIDKWKSEEAKKYGELTIPNIF